MSGRGKKKPLGEINLPPLLLLIKGWMGKYIVKGSPELIKLAYDTGLGAKNSQGFGCFEISR